MQIHVERDRGLSLPSKVKAQKCQESLKPTQTAVRRHHLQIKHNLVAAFGIHKIIEPEVKLQSTQSESNLAHKPYAPDGHRLTAANEVCGTHFPIGPAITRD